MRANPISTNLDFEREGVRHGHLKLPHSHDGSAWGAVMIPITVAKRGRGPTVLLSGGNHGDEYEGPIALFSLARSLENRDFQGRIIIVPAMNFPAFKAGRRTSPIDGGNMNRVFPGKADGTATEKIADYFQRQLLPLADYVADIHSGGKTLTFLPFCGIHRLDDQGQQARAQAAMEAFGAPYSVISLEMDPDGMYDTAAERMGKVFISTELGGGGSASAATVAIAKRGLDNLLKHAGVLPGSPEPSDSQLLDMPDARCFITSESNGLVEYLVDLGAEVAAGQTIARVHDLDRTGAPPRDYQSRIDGLFFGRHFPGLIAMGDPVGIVGVRV